MAQFNHQQYDDIERSVSTGRRIVVWRRGTEYIVVPTALRVREGRELIEARNPTTGDHMTLCLDELDRIEVVT
jgi:hypothetical protein